MNPHHFHPGRGGPCSADHGPGAFAANITAAAGQNRNFRTTFWTGDSLQMTLMHIPPQSEVGLETHPDTDQFIRVEQGRALVCLGDRPENLSVRRYLTPGCGIFIPAGLWHNILNAGPCPLKLSSIYAPPHHPRGTVHGTPADAARDH